MASTSRSAADRPLRSASETVGPHLLGRLYTPDSRDWSVARLMELAEPPDSILDQTINQVLTGTSYFSDWTSYLVLWRWLKKRQQPAKPDQPDQPDKPLADTTPGWALNVQLDQGQTNQCVGFGWSGWVDAMPVEGHNQNACANEEGWRHSPLHRALRRSTPGSTPTVRSSSARPGPTTCSTRTRMGSSS